MEDALKRIFNACWKCSSQEPDYVVVLDPCGHFCRNDIKGHAQISRISGDMWAMTYRIASYMGTVRMTLSCIGHERKEFCCHNGI